MMQLVTPVSTGSHDHKNSFQSSLSGCGVDFRIKDYARIKSESGSPAPMDAHKISQLDQSGDLNSCGSDSEKEEETAPLRSCFRLIKDAAKRRFENCQLLQEQGYDVNEQTTLYQIVMTPDPRETHFNQCLLLGQYRIQWLVEASLKEAVEGKPTRIQFSSNEIELTFSEKNGLSKSEALELIASEDSDDIAVLALEDCDIPGFISRSALPLKA